MSTTRAPRKPKTDFVDAFSIQAVETFVERVRTRVMTERSSFAAAMEAELIDWQTAVPDEVRHGWKDEDHVPE